MGDFIHQTTIRGKRGCVGWIFIWPREHPYNFHDVLPATLSKSCFVLPRMPPSVSAGATLLGSLSLSLSIERYFTLKFRLFVSKGNTHSYSYYSTSSALSLGCYIPSPTLHHGGAILDCHSKLGHWVDEFVQCSAQ